MKEYYFEEVESVTPFRIRTAALEWGWFILIRVVWCFRTHGGQWWHTGLFLSTQIIFSIPALVLDIVAFIIGWATIISYRILKFILSRLFISVNNKVVQPILHILSIAAALTLLYILYTTGTWQKIAALASAFISQL